MRPTAGLVLNALDQALHDRRPAKGSGLIPHGDRGSRSVAIRYTERPTEAEARSYARTEGVAIAA
ncbi:hypothetical protein FHS63_003728 [Azospirillum doebereinerae]